MRANAAALDDKVLSLLRERGPCPYSGLQPDLDDPIAAGWALERLRQRGLITWDDSRPAVYRALPAAEMTD